MSEKIGLDPRLRHIVLFGPEWSHVGRGRQSVGHFLPVAVFEVSASGVVPMEHSWPQSWSPAQPCVPPAVCGLRVGPGEKAFADRLRHSGGIC